MLAECQMLLPHVIVKVRQINRYLEIVEETLPYLPQSDKNLKIIDALVSGATPGLSPFIIII